MALFSQVFVFGSNDRGQCILPHGGFSVAVPTAAQLDWLPDGKHVLKMAVGISLSLLLADDNQLFAVGGNEYGQLGRGHSNVDDPDNAPWPASAASASRRSPRAAATAPP